MKQVHITEANVNEAMAQVEALDGLQPRDINCLRLLTEELFSLCKELLHVEQLDFVLSRSDKTYELGITTKTQINEAAREQFLSLSSTGKNMATKGVKGLLGTVLEMFSINDPTFNSVAHLYGVYSMGGEAAMWSLSRYMEVAPKETISEDWDGMEKSIIANFADDVHIGVRSGKLEMRIQKTF